MEITKRAVSYGHTTPEIINKLQFDSIKSSEWGMGSVGHTVFKKSIKFPVSLLGEFMFFY